MKWAVVLALLLALPASAKDGRYPKSGLGAPRPDVVEDPWVRCSDLPDPNESTTVLTTATSSSDLHEDVMTACSGGCIIELGPGTYTENIVFGDAALKATSINPTGEVLIRAQDPANPPVIQAELDVKAAVIHAKDVTQRIRLEDIILDGRRSEQTENVINTICTDTTPANGICDAPNQTQTFASGFNTRNTGSGVTSSCLLRVQVRNTVTTGIQLTDPYLTTVEDSTVTGAGCTPALCPNLDIPLDTDTNALLEAAQGVQLQGGSDSAVIESAISDVTKIGIECFTDTRRCHIHDNTITRAGIAGIVLNEADGTVVSNSVSEVGQWFAHNSTANNVGQGMQFTNGDDYADAGFRVLFSGNRVNNVFGTGIQIALAETLGSRTYVELRNNIVTDACDGTTLSTAAGIILGDNTQEMREIKSAFNSAQGSNCIDGFRVQNVRSYRGNRDSSSHGLEVDDVAEFQAYDLDITGNLDIDADTKGRIERCSLTGDVLGAAAVERIACGAAPEAISTDWDTLLWDVDDWG